MRKAGRSACSAVSAAAFSPRLKALCRSVLFCALAATTFGRAGLYFDASPATTLVTNEITLGWAFSPGTYRPAVVEQLGMFDNFGEIQEPHVVGLWKVETTCVDWPRFTCTSIGTLVASVLFVPGEDVFKAGGYRFHSIAPLQLEPNRIYVVATHYTSNSLDPITTVEPEHTPYTPVGTVYGFHSVPVTNDVVGPLRRVYAKPEHFAAANVIFSTNPPPIPHIALHRTPRRIGETSYAWLVSSNDQPVSVVMDALQSSDPENESLQFQWLLTGEPPTPLGEGAVLTNIFPVGQSIGLTLRISDGLQYVDAYEHFQTYSPEGAVNAMRDKVRASNARRMLKSSLLASLRNAELLFRRHRPDRALVRLGRFEDRIRLRLQTVDATSAGELLDAAAAIREAFQGEALSK